ncbi:SAS-6 [Mytilus edulis]|uniref:SAS-6 n=1 Tax=Mytilus edulis TaxID=6550 RepID=A0A8S3SDD1_MYTED|nr:SAS-6 [Mytilus edulis]
MSEDLTQTHTIITQGVGVPRNYPNRQPQESEDLTQTHTIRSRSTKKLSQQTTTRVGVVTINYNSGSLNHESEDLTQTHTIITQGVGVPRNYPNRQPQVNSHHYNSGVGVPRNYPNRQPQVQYNPGNPRRTTIPQPSGGRGGPPPPIPEEIRPHHHSPASNHSGGDKENDPPLDPKYLQKSDDAIHIRGLGPRTHSPPTISSSAPNLNSVRLSQQGIVPRTTQPPLASAYFPGQKMS